MDIDKFAGRAQIPLTLGGYVGWGYTLWPKGAVLFGNPRNVNWTAVIAVTFLLLGLLSAAHQLGWPKYVQRRFSKHKPEPSFISEPNLMTSPPSKESASLVIKEYGEPQFVRHPDASFTSKVRLDLINVGDKPVHCLSDIRWTLRKGDLGIQSYFGFGYWVYPEGSANWDDKQTDPIIKPNERFHVWVGLDPSRSDDDLTKHRRAGRVGILQLPIEVGGHKSLLEFPL